ncbi:MAG: tetratricopeptide repeat protein [Planctomycetota bacterium]|jgi:tetratricopeptide (TPR) repeat protein
MVISLTTKTKKRQCFKLWAYAFCLCLLLINCSLSSQCLADTQADYLDPIEILISSAPDNTNEPDKPHANMKITENEPVITQTQTVFPLDFTAPFDQDLLQNPSSINEKPTSDAERQLFQASISILSNDDDNSKIKSELQNLIEQINNIELQSENTESEITHQIPLNQQPDTQPELVPQERREKPQIITAQADLNYTPITDETLQTLEKLSQKPEQVDNPFEIAELLFLSNHLDKSALFYAEALNRTSSDNSISAQRKAWILFQMGNCLRKTEPNRAKQMYTQLINEFPESSWTEPAKGQVQLIDFYLTDEPEKIITDNQSL